MNYGSKKHILSISSTDIKIYVQQSNIQYISALTIIQTSLDFSELQCEKLSISRVTTDSCSFSFC